MSRGKGSCKSPGAREGLACSRQERNRGEGDGIREIAGSQATETEWAAEGLRLVSE